MSGVHESAVGCMRVHDQPPTFSKCSPDILVKRPRHLLSRNLGSRCIYQEDHLLNLRSVTLP